MSIISPDPDKPASVVASSHLHFHEQKQTNETTLLVSNKIHSNVKYKKAEFSKLNDEDGGERRTFVASHLISEQP